jgi:long-subunit fatty acid transport protein
VTYKSPLSVGVGAAYGTGPATFHASAEWYDAVPAYDVLAPDPVILPDTTRASFGLVQELESVTNVAVGAEYLFSPKLTGYAGFRTDQSAINAESSDNTSLALWDLYHVSGGGTFSMGASDFTIGGIVAWGSEQTRTGIDLVPGDDPLDLPDELQANFFRITLVLGFSIGF